jgi:hypothetical protein
MTHDDPHLARAIEGLYTTFARYPLAPIVEGCDCCVDPEDKSELAAAPLRTINNAALDKFASKALTTWGDDDDFKHFLPRLLELETSGGLDSNTAVSSKIVYADWHKWPAEERDAVVAYYQAKAFSRLSSDRDKNSLPLALLEAVRLRIDMAPFLAAWTQRKSEPAVLWRLVDLSTNFDGTWLFMDLAMTSEYAGSIAWRQLRAWMLDPATEDILTNAYLTGNIGSTVLNATELDAIATAADHFADYVGQLKAQERPRAW